MPDEIDFDPREAQEKVEEHLHGDHDGHDGHGSGGDHAPHEEKKPDWTRLIPLTTAVIAVVAAVAAMQAGALVNEALIEKSNAVQSQSQASDQWAYYQAKGIKGNTAQQTADLLAVAPAGAERAKFYASEAKRYKTEQREAEEKAHELEKERDAKAAESEHLMHRHHTFAFCVTFSQIAIALAAIAALTRRRPMWYISVALGLISAGYMLYGFLPH